MEVGELYNQRATAALSPAFLFFYLSLNWPKVCDEATLAAKAFKAANLDKEAAALRLCSNTEDQMGKALEAWRLLEQEGRHDRLLADN
ncbi:hypothetical protein cyc_05214 [Cyclospora cayetanensis]|uniref:Uncharacterized protein n=1 Tax=Cyclospora cayetanensis TaxID=88456 RepID=A0A1D3CRR5_9EIME|nr:hypothetical protein cyc_05214 [Cyclospora cayetanensis]